MFMCATRREGLLFDYVFDRRDGPRTKTRQRTVADSHERWQAHFEQQKTKQAEAQPKHVQPRVAACRRQLAATKKPWRN